MRLVLINKRMYAVGLQWQLGGEAPRSVLRKEAQTLDSALDMVVICPRQHGFGTSNGTPLPFTRARSLSASLRMPFGSFLGLFALETTDSAPLWWVIAFSKGVFTAFSDMTFTEREDAEKQVNELRNLLEKVEQSVVCDTPQESAAWLSPLLKTGLLEEFFGHSRVQSLVEIPGQRKKIAAFGAVVLCVLLCGFGLSTFLEYQAGQRAVEQARLAFMDKEKHRQDVLAHPERHFPMPWTTEPTVLDKANVCLPELLRLPLVVNGWELDAATCDGKSVSVTWAHSAGADYLALPPAAMLDKTAKKAVSRVLLQPAPPRVQATFKTFLTQECLSRNLYQLTQTLSAKLTLSFNKADKKTVDTIDILAPWLRGQWVFDDIPASLVGDPALAETLTLPGMVLDEIAFKNAVWSFRGDAYVSN